ncbi:amino acid ABC transporter substrate-binding protein [Skermanella stibiiresistens SB22]|uniref:Amino acid ABC transporter substrate-binding protein n=1 Tax=Skermanella stibiiresistens SB22 TaxID=1385369 RepID=W9H4C4_9PROT|nr:ABC transporter ATP-binding protein [Skermanella stibiiresistens]EWY39572.1 amino acid ABC transporter substrate-binding protein [Skermanella stibiiresistens SB22]
MTFLQLQGVGKRYGGTPALDGIGFDVPPGGRTAIVGPSGSGKTTLLRIIAGFEAPDVGRVTMGGQVLAEGPAIVPAHLRGIGFVPQDGALFPHLSVADNIGFGLARGMVGRETRVRDLMDMVELDRAMAERRPHELSGGQQQRVALARALARQPKLMLLDEPFSALDTRLRETMRKAVAKVLRAAGVTTILVTHDQTEALSFADQVAVLRDGRLTQVGSPRELYLRPSDRDTAAFLGDVILLPADLGDDCVVCGLGRLPADVGGRRGRAEIMLRPEQVRLTPMAPGQADPSPCQGEVVDVEFGGAVSMVRVSVRGGAGTAWSDTELWIRSSSVDLPAVGALVGISILGGVHVFDQPATGRTLRAG